jgi:flagellar hook-length control protein FliK
MIHNLSALPAVQHPGGKSPKAGAEAAILALFGEALAAQLQAADAASPSAGGAAIGAAPTVALPEGLGAVAGETLPQAGGGGSADPAKALTAEKVLDPAQMSGLAASVLPMQGPTEPGVPPVTPESEPTDAAVGLVPAARKNPLALVGQKNLPVTPAGIAANPHAFRDVSDQDLPVGIQMKVDLDGLGMKAGLPGLETGVRPGSLAAVEGLVDVARPASAPAAFAMPTVQGEALGVSSAASRQVAQLVTPFMQPQWQSELGEKVVWLAGRQGQLAELSLNPPSLGSIEVRLNLSGQEAGAQFFSANPVVREAIEAALPRLREMMAEAGLSLGQAMVSSEPFRDRDASPQQAAGERDEDERVGVLSLAGGAVGRQSPTGLVDLYV